MSYVTVTPATSTIPVVTYPKCCKRVGAHFEAALVDPMEKSPKDAIAFLGNIRVDLCQSDRGLTFDRLVV